MIKWIAHCRRIALYERSVDGDLLREAQKQIARRCAMLPVECEIMESAAVAGEPFDLDVYGQLTDRLGRAFQRLGLKRVMHDVTPDLGAYLTATAARNSQDGLGATAAFRCIRSRNGRQRPTSSIGDHVQAPSFQASF